MGATELSNMSNLTVSATVIAGPRALRAFPTPQPGTGRSGPGTGHVRGPGKQRQRTHCRQVRRSGAQRRRDEEIR